MRKLFWSDFDYDNLERTVAVLDVINPHGYTASQIQSIVDGEFYNRDLQNYMGTGGWYVTIYRSPSLDAEHGCEVWKPLVTLMPYCVEKYLGLDKKEIAA